jgi:integrase
MLGRIYAKGRCPECGGKFARTENDLICPIHFTRPRKFYIQLRTNRENVYSDRNGYSFSSFEHANQTLNKIRVEIREGSFDITRYVAQQIRPLRFKNWSDAWLKRKEIEVEKGLKSPSYFKTLAVYVVKYQEFFKESDLRDISTKMVDDFRLSFSGSPKYLKNILDALEKMFRDALDWGDVKQMPKFPKIEQTEPDRRIIDLDRQDEVINSIPDQMDRAYILFTAREMVRPSETRALWWDDIDFKHGVVTIRRHFSLSQLREATKARQIKHLPLDADVRESLLRLPHFLGCSFVFQKKGRPFSESWARKVWKRHCPEVSLYQGTRHSSATEAADRVGVDMVQEFLHHTSRKMTERYVKENAERLRKVVRK